MRTAATMLAGRRRRPVSAGCASSDEGMNGPGGDDSGPIKIGVIVPSLGERPPDQPDSPTHDAGTGAGETAHVPATTGTPTKERP